LYVFVKNRTKKIERVHFPIFLSWRGEGLGVKSLLLEKGLSLLFLDKMIQHVILAVFLLFASEGYVIKPQFTALLWNSVRMASCMKFYAVVGKSDLHYWLDGPCRLPMECITFMLTKLSTEI